MTTVTANRGETATNRANRGKIEEERKPDGASERGGERARHDRSQASRMNRQFRGFSNSANSNGIKRPYAGLFRFLSFSSAKARSYIRGLIVT